MSAEPSAAALAAAEAAFRRAPGDATALADYVRLLRRVGRDADAFAALDGAGSGPLPPELVAEYATLRDPGDPPPPARARGLPPPPADARPKGPPAIAALAFDSRERFLAAGTRGGDLWLYDLTELGRPPGRLGRVPKGVTAAAFTPDGTAVITGGADQTVRRWPLATPGKGEILDRGYEGAVTGVAADGATVVAASEWTWRRIDPDGAGPDLDWPLGDPCPPPRSWARPGGEAGDLARVRSATTEDPATGGSRSRFPGLGDITLGSRRCDVRPVFELTGAGAAVIGDGAAVLIDGAGTPRALTHPEVFPGSRTFQEALVIAAVAPQGRALLCGSVNTEYWDPDGDPPEDLATGARLFRPGAPPRVDRFLPETAVTAVAFSPRGFAAALGGAGGEVVWVDLAPRR